MITFIIAVIGPFIVAIMAWLWIRGMK